VRSAEYEREVGGGSPLSGLMAVQGLAKRKAPS
jgi:hypothetical protein